MTILPDEAAAAARGLRPRTSPGRPPAGSPCSWPPPSSPRAGTPSPTCCAPSGRSPRGTAPTTGASSRGPRGRACAWAAPWPASSSRTWSPTGPVTLVGDDTVDGHPGRQVYGKARHRDPVRSSHAYTAWRYGHRWVVLAVLVRFPFAARPWALPVLVDLYRSEEDDRRRRRPHRTPAQLMCRLLRAAHDPLPRPPLRLRRRLRLRQPRGRPLRPPPPRPARRWSASSTPRPTCSSPRRRTRGKGRPRVKGARRPKPREAVGRGPAATELTVGWYGGGTRRVEVVTGTGHWYKAGDGLVPIRWVFVHDLEGTHRDEYFYATDPALDPGRDRDPVRRPLEHRVHLPGEPRPPPIGDDAGLVPADGAAGHAVPVRALLGGGPAVPRAARGEAVGGRELARQGRCDLLGRPGVGAALDLGPRGYFHRPGRGPGWRNSPSRYVRPGNSPRPGRIADSNQNH